uniref:CCHC-type domain-containing protein n=1 Tax=Timema shepardi TaxID=629360 RepID=A0A7R9ANP9_TIMSH|nr:unnamed protein product [Timema shepardi]
MCNGSLVFQSDHCPRFELPATDIQQKDGKKLVITCHYCGESGHKALYCNKMPAEIREVQSKQDEFRTAEYEEIEVRVSVG